MGLAWWRQWSRVQQISLGCHSMGSRIRGQFVNPAHLKQQRQRKKERNAVVADKWTYSNLSFRSPWEIRSSWPICNVFFKERKSWDACGMFYALQNAPNSNETIFLHTSLGTLAELTIIHLFSNTCNHSLSKTKKTQWEAVNILSISMQVTLSASFWTKPLGQYFSRGTFGKNLNFNTAS